MGYLLPLFMLVSAIHSHTLCIIVCHIISLKSHSSVCHIELCVCLVKGFRQSACLWLQCKGCQDPVKLQHFHQNNGDEQDCPLNDWKVLHETINRPLMPLKWIGCWFKRYYWTGSSLQFCIRKSALFFLTKNLEYIILCMWECFHLAPSKEM